MAISSGAREIAAVLDTALLQALVLTGQSSAAVELLKTVNYCEVKICEEFLQKRNHYDALLELYKCNAMHHEALKLLHQLIEESKSDQAQAELRQKFKPEMIIDYLKVGLPVYCEYISLSEIWMDDMSKIWHLYSQLMNYIIAL